MGRRTRSNYRMGDVPMEIVEVERDIPHLTPVVPPLGTHVSLTHFDDLIRHDVIYTTSMVSYTAQQRRGFDVLSGTYYYIT